MLVKKKAIMVKEIEVRETKDIMLIPIDKGEIQKPTHIVMLQNIVSPLARKNMPRDL